MSQKRERERAWYYKNRDRLLLKHEADRTRRVNYLHECLGDCCVQCGSKNELEFDHIDPSLKTHRTSPRAMGKEAVDKELHNLQVLCKPCHKRRSLAQKAAAWDLFCQLTLEEQDDMISTHLDQGKMTKTYRQL